MDNVSGFFDSTVSGLDLGVTSQEPFIGLPSNGPNLTGDNSLASLRIKTSGAFSSEIEQLQDRAQSSRPDSFLASPVEQSSPMAAIASLNPATSQAVDPLTGSLLNESLVGLDSVSATIIKNRDINSVENKLSSFFTTVSNNLGSALSEVNLPVIGTAFEDFSTDISDTLDTLKTAIGGKLTTNQLTAEKIAQKLSSIPGLEVEVNVNTPKNIEFSLDYENSLSENMPLFSKEGGLLEFVNISDAFTPVNVLAEVVYGLTDLTFGINASGAYIDQKDLSLDTRINLDLPDTAISGLKLGVLDIELTEPKNGNDFSFEISVDPKTYDTTVNYGDVKVINLFGFNTAIADRSISIPGIGEITFGFPEVSGDLQLDLSGLGKSGSSSESSFPFKLADIGLDLSDIKEQFLNPFISPVEQLIQPLQDVVEVLYEPIPLLDDLAQSIPKMYDVLDRGGNINGTPEISLRDIIEVVADAKSVEVDFEFFDQGIQVLNAFETLQLKEEKISLGNIEFSQGNFIKQPLEEGSLLDSSLPEGFGIPLLERPADVIFSSLLGNQTDLITYSTPELKFNGTLGEVIPIIGPLGVFVGGNFNIKAQFSFGYDTNGLSTGFLEDGFYIADSVNGEDVQELSFDLGPRLGPGIQVGAASIGTFLGFSGGLGLNWNDDDGAVRLGELKERLGDSFRPFELFDVGINLGAGFGGEINLAGITLWRPELNGSVQIAEISGTEIQNTADSLFEKGREAVDVLEEVFKVASKPTTLDKAVDFAKFLWDETSAGVVDVASALWNSSLVSDSFELAKVLLDGGAGLTDIPGALKSVANRSLGGIFSDLVSGAGLSDWQAINAIGFSDLNLINKTFPDYAGFLWTNVGAKRTIEALQEGGRKIGGIFSDLVSGVHLSELSAVRALRDVDLIDGNFAAYAGFLWTNVGSVRTIKALQEGGRNLGNIFSDLVSGAGLRPASTIEYLIGAEVLGGDFNSIRKFLLSQFNEFQTLGILKELGFTISKVIDPLPEVPPIKLPPIKLPPIKLPPIKLPPIKLPPVKLNPFE